MSATRTQIYLTSEQRRRIDELTTANGLTLAEVVRQALDRYFETERPDATSALSATFGALPNIDVPDRSEWDRG